MLIFLFSALIVGMFFYALMAALAILTDWEIMSYGEGAMLVGLIATLLLGMYSIIVLL